MKAEKEFDLGERGGTRAESVSEFTRRVKTLLESGIRPGWVRGEVSNLRAQASGHVYFSLKDAGAQLSAVLFRGDAARWNPAELLIAALSACHQLWYLHLCADAGIVVIAYSDDASGVEIDGLSEQLLCHDGALDMPSGPAFSPWALPKDVSIA